MLSADGRAAELRALLATTSSRPALLTRSIHGVIAHEDTALWADIIAEDPGYYATSEGMAGLDAETEFLPCTTGLPDE